MLSAFCKCLNLGVKAEDSSVQDDLEDFDAPGGDTNGNNAFFGLSGPKLLPARLPFDFNTKNEKLSVFIEKRTFNGWSIKKCLLCDTDVYASNISCSSRILVDSALIKNENDLAAIRSSADYSPAFDVLLPRGLSKSLSKGFPLPPSMVHSVNNVVAQKLRKERHELDSRIQNFVDRETAKFEQFKARAKIDEELVLKLAAAKSLQSTAVSPRQWSIGVALNDDRNDDDGRSTGVDVWSTAGAAAVASIDEPYDSGVPVSPASGRWSPPTAVVTAADWLPMTAVVAPDFDNDSREADDFARSLHNTLKPQSNVLVTKRKRHSGGNGKPPSLVDASLFGAFDKSEELTDAAQMEQDDQDQFDENYAADDSSDSENFQQRQQQHQSVDGATSVAADIPAVLDSSSTLCRSLPVAIVGRQLAPSPPPVDDDLSLYGGGQRPGVTLADSMAALSRSLRPRDDPESLFGAAGARPGRRRFRSAFDGVAVYDAGFGTRLETVTDVADDQF